MSIIRDIIGNPNLKNSKKNNNKILIIPFLDIIKI